MAAIEYSQVMIIAHRGARSLAPENTLPAAAKALENYADGWELDVAMSADGELVVLHDDTLERTSNVMSVFPDRKPWSVYEFSLAELQQLDFGSWFVESDPFGQISQGNVAASDLENYRGTRIPKLEEALEYTKSNHWWVNIEIKDASGTPSDAVIVSEVVRLVENMGMEDQVLISSFNWDYLNQVKALNPNLATGVLAKSIVMDPVSLMKKIDAQAFHPGIKVTLAAQVKQLRENNYDVNVWTVNEVSDMERLIEMGVTGIITDFPQRLYPIINP
ncbi:MAG TPA: glycerophosphodiester phosphodiesterase family protein [Brevefilum sp.]|nr:glycerophosphodiester phosphodiesterase family protein [Brevefilum sp.]HOR18583.1 glycerophosphodiester phosphodiesterase family protein [Brevefilum sp.]HPL69022.1 glycerophosphodiester phosphodiesterase family protein [Brevefilum sp.]